MVAAARLRRALHAFRPRIIGESRECVHAENSFRLGAEADMDSDGFALSKISLQKQSGVAPARAPPPTLLLGSPATLLSARSPPRAKETKRAQPCQQPHRSGGLGCEGHIPRPDEPHGRNRSGRPGPAIPAIVCGNRHRQSRCLIDPSGNFVRELFSDRETAGAVTKGSGRRTPAVRAREIARRKSHRHRVTRDHSRTVRTGRP